MLADMYCKACLFVLSCPWRLCIYLSMQLQQKWSAMRHTKVVARRFVAAPAASTLLKDSGAEASGHWLANGSCRKRRGRGGGGEAPSITTISGAVMPIIVPAL